MFIEQTNCVMEESSVSVNITANPIHTNMNRDILTGWIEQCQVRSLLHRSYSTTCSILHSLITLPSIVAPLVSTSLYTDEVINMSTLTFILLALACSTISLTYNFAQKSAVHQQFFHRYAILSKEIQFEFCRLGQMDDDNVFIQRCVENWFHLESLAPHVSYDK